ncbi:unnamed protein product [Symbiodinium microadriaticum]|nr:unnamed protein product [Symbiodinium microadriaticum]
MYHFGRVLFAITLAVVTIFPVYSQVSTTCPDYDYTKIKLVTFDCFAALMQWENSMFDNVAEILPSLTSSQVHDLVTKWEGKYGNAQGTRFEEKQTGAFPFSWYISTQLQPILDDMKITVTRDEYDQLVKSWGNLRPWTNTQATLEKILNANITIAVLSNGDKNTLSNAVTVFPSTVTFTYIFSSDFPAGVFKPQHDIYEQAKTVGYDVSEILHVAGGPTDGHGAYDAGLFSAVTSSKSFTNHAALSGASDGSVTAKTGDTTCFELGDISEVTEILGLGPL